MIWHRYPSRASFALPVAAVAAVALPAAPAAALPGLDMSAGLYGAYNLAGGGYGADLDAFVGTPVLKASGHIFTLANAGSLGELVLRFEPLPIPFVAFRPGLGYQGNDLFVKKGTSTKPAGFDHAPYGSLMLNAAVPLVPVSGDVEVGASYPIALAEPVFAYSANVNFSPIPLVPVALSVRYRGYAQGTNFAPGLSAIEGGLRVNL